MNVQVLSTLLTGITHLGVRIPPLLTWPLTLRTLTLAIRTGLAGNRVAPACSTPQPRSLSSGEPLPVDCKIYCFS